MQVTLKEKATPSRRTPNWLRAVVTGALLSALAVPARAQLPMPQLKTIRPLGGKIGSTFEIAIGGDDLDDVRELQFSEAGIAAKRKMDQASEFDEAKPVPNQFVIHVDADVPPGLVEVRAVGYFGVSNPRFFAIDRLDEVFAADGLSLEDAAPLPIGTAITAVASPESVDYYKLHVPAGQKVLVECFAQRLDSQLDATLVLFDETGREVRRVRDTFGRDPVLLVAPHEDRDYVVGVYDFTFRGGSEYFYRLAAHTQPRLAYAQPPVLQEGAQTQELTLFGWNLPGGEPAGEALSLAAAPLERLKVQATLEGPLVVPAATEPHAVFAAGIPYRLDGPEGPTNPVFIQTTPHPVVVESDENDKPEHAESMPVPGEFVGRIESAGDRDWIEFAGNRGDVLYIDVIADRMGAAADIALAVHKVAIRADGSTEMRQIANVDDRSYGRDGRFDISSTDPAERIVVEEPAIYRVEVRDLYDNPTGDGRLVYRLSVRRNAPDFRLTAIVDPPRGADNQPLPIGSLSLRQGGAAGVVVCAHRLGGFEGPIEVTARGLPEGTTCRPARIRPGEDRASLVISAADNAPAWCGPIDVTGRAELADRTRERSAIGGTTTSPAANPNARPAARLCRGVELAVCGAPPSPALLQLPEEVVTTCVGGKVKIPVAVEREEGFAADVNLAPVGLVDGLQWSASAVAKDAEQTEAELFVSKADFTPGMYEFHVRSRVRANLPRNPEAIVGAQTRKERFDKLLAEKSSAAEALTAARDALRMTAETAAADLEAREAELAAAREVSASAVAAQEEVVQRLAAAREGMATDAGSAESATALESVQGEAVAAIEAARVARAKVVDSEAAVAAAQATADVFATRLALVERDLQTASEAKTRIEKLRDEANKQFEEAQKTHGPRDYEFELITQPVRVVVEDAPVAISVDDEPITVTPGAERNAKVHVERKFGFEGDVELKLIPREGLAVDAQAIRVPKGSDSVTLPVRTRPDAAAGRDTCELEASMEFNGVPIKKRVPLALVVSSRIEQ